MLRKVHFAFYPHICSKKMLLLFHTGSNKWKHPAGGLWMAGLQEGEKKKSKKERNRRYTMALCSRYVHAQGFR